MIKKHNIILVRLLILFILTSFFYSCNNKNTNAFKYNGADNNIRTFERLLLNNRSDLALNYLKQNNFIHKIVNEDYVAYWIIYYWDNHMPMLIDYLFSKGLTLSKDLPLMHLAIENINYEAFVWLSEQGFDAATKHRYGKFIDDTSAIEYIKFMKLELINYYDDSDEIEESPELLELKRIERYIIISENLK